jgi:hypothetical protein
MLINRVCLCALVLSFFSLPVQANQVTIKNDARLHAIKYQVVYVSKDKRLSLSSERIYTMQPTDSTESIYFHQDKASTHSGIVISAVKISNGAQSEWQSLSKKQRQFLSNEGCWSSGQASLVVQLKTTPHAVSVIACSRENKT